MHSPPGSGPHCHCSVTLAGSFGLPMTTAPVHSGLYLKCLLCAWLAWSDRMDGTISRLYLSYKHWLAWLPFSTANGIRYRSPWKDRHQVKHLWSTLCKNWSQYTLPFGLWLQSTTRIYFLISPTYSGLRHAVHLNLLTSNPDSEQWMRIEKLNVSICLGFLSWTVSKLVDKIGCRVAWYHWHSNLSITLLPISYLCHYDKFSRSSVSSRGW